MVTASARLATALVAVRMIRIVQVTVEVSVLFMEPIPVPLLVMHAATAHVAPFLCFVVIGGGGVNCGDVGRLSTGSGQRASDDGVMTTNGRQPSTGKIQPTLDGNLTGNMRPTTDKSLYIYIGSNQHTIY